MAPVVDVGLGGRVSTLAGTGDRGYRDGAAAAAKLNDPGGIALDGSGSLYIADYGNHRIRVLAAGRVSTLAGTGRAGALDGAALTPSRGRRERMPSDV